MKVQIIFVAFIISLTSAVPVKRGIFDNISHFPFLASSSSAHGSSGSSSSSSDEFDFHDYHHHHHHDTIPEFHSVTNAHLIHHPEIDGHHHDYLHGYDHDVPISYQNQYFGHDVPVPTSYHSQHLFDNHLSGHDNQFNDFNKYDGLHDSLLELSNLDAPEFSHDSHGPYISDIDDYKNYGGDLGDYTHHAGLLDISDDHKIDHLLDPYSPNHSSYDSY